MSKAQQHNLFRTANGQSNLLSAVFVTVSRLVVDAFLLSHIAIFEVVESQTDLSMSDQSSMMRLHP